MINEVNKKIINCKMCELSKLKFNIQDVSKGYGKLLGWGSKKPKIMFIGMNPSHRRFHNLKYVFGGIGFKGGTGINLVKCSTSDNKIKKEYSEKCFENLKYEIEVLKPIKIIALGNDVYNFLINKQMNNVCKIWHPNYVFSYNISLLNEYRNKILKLLNV